MSRRSFLFSSAVLLGCAITGRAFAAPAVEPAPSPEVVTARPDLEARLRRSPRLAPVIDQAATYRMQVLVSVPEPGTTRWLGREGFRVDAEYFYPASAIKLCEAVAALEAVTDLREGGAAELDVGASLFSESASKRRGGATSVANLVSGALVMSDNDASNDLFDLAGADGLHERMWRIGLSSVRVRHRFGVTPGDTARSTPRIELMTGAGPVVVPPREGKLELGRNEEPGVRVGESQVVAGRVVDEPMAFDEKNRISLQDLQDLLVAIMRPDLRGDAVPRLGREERAALIGALSALPSSRGVKTSADVEHKPLLAGIERVVPRQSLTFASKSGRAYGFLVDNAYAVDARTGRSFFLSTVLYTNANGRMNDDLYEYQTLGFPLLAEIGEVVARSVFREAND